MFSSALLRFFVYFTFVWQNGFCYVRVSIEVSQAFNQFIVQFNKTYTNETARDMAIVNFNDDYLLVKAHNRLAAAGNSTFVLRINQYSDKSLKKKKSILNGFRNPFKEVNSTTSQPSNNQDYNEYFYDSFSSDISSSNQSQPSQHFSSGPPSIDWRELGAVTDVQDQGYICSSCWAFSSTGAIEGQFFKTTGNLRKFSEQDLIDCNINDLTGNWGCNGGYMHIAFEYIKLNQGLMLAQDYPLGNFQYPCKYKSSKRAVKIVDYFFLPPGDEETLKNAVAAIGPISVSMDGGQNSFFSYGGGIYADDFCTQEPNHAVLIVGYGTDPIHGDYWICKNSWSIWWGEEGFFKIKRGINLCGIANYMVYPTIVSAT